MYAGFTGSVLLIAVFRSFLFFETARRAGTRMHHRMAHTVLHAPLAFFHTNPSGRVLNRFSKVRLKRSVDAACCRTLSHSTVRKAYVP